MYKIFILSALSLFYSGLAIAQDDPVINYGGIYDQYSLDTSQSTDYLQLSANSKAQQSFTKQTSGSKARPVFEEDWLTANKVHKYLGIGSITLAILAAIVPKPPKDNPDDGNHKQLAEGAALLGGAAVATGLMFHYDDIFNYGASDPDNLHATYATLGAIGFALAVSDAPEAQHVGYGVLGAVLMTIGIKYTW